MKYTLRTTKKFEKSVKLCVKRNCPMEELRTVMSILVEKGTLPIEYRPHKLKGKRSNCVWDVISNQTGYLFGNSMTMN